MEFWTYVGLCEGGGVAFSCVWCVGAVCEGGGYAWCVDCYCVVYSVCRGVLMMMGVCVMV